MTGGKRIAAEPIFPDFPFTEHFARLSTLQRETEQALGTDWDLYQDGMQLLYDTYAAAATRLAVPHADRKDAALMTSTQAVSALSSAGTLALQGDSVRSIVCSRQGLEELLHYLACLYVPGVAARYLDGKTPRPVEIRRAIKAQPLVTKTYASLSKPAHGSLLNPLLMHGEGWLPLHTGRANIEGVRDAVGFAIAVITIGLPIIAVGMGVSEEAWHLEWHRRFGLFMDAWRADLAGRLDELSERMAGRDEGLGG